MTVSTDPLVPEGFPDLFVYALRDALAGSMLIDPAFPADNIQTRPVRPGDPNRTVSVVEGTSTPLLYEIGVEEPAATRWTVIIQVLAKGVDETDARNTRKRLIQRARKTFFAPATVQSLMTLSDESVPESVSRVRLIRTDFDSASARDANQQFAFLGMIELSFDTEYRGDA